MALFFALTCYENMIISSKLPILVHCHHRPILYLFARKANLNHRFYKYQMILTKFHNLRIVWTPGKNLPIPDLLSRNFSVDQIERERLRHKQIPPEITFTDANQAEILYFIEHEKNFRVSDELTHTILVQTPENIYKLQLDQEGNEYNAKLALDVDLSRIRNLKQEVN